MSGKKAGNIYDLIEQDFKISSDFLKLSLDNAELSVPSEYGEYDITLNLNGDKVFTENINVSEVAKISYIYPVYVAAAVPTVFYAEISGNKNIVKYTWDFGTGKINTTENFIEYAYPNIGNHSLSLSIEDEDGKTTSETFSIEVSSPKNVVNQTLGEYRPNLNALKSEIATLPAWYKVLVEKESDVDNLNAQLTNLEGKYTLASTTQDYIDIMNKLNNLSIPKEIKTKTGNLAKLAEANNIDVDVLTELGAGENNTGYEQAVAEWSNNQDINLGYETIYLDYGEKEKDIASVFNLKIKTKEDLGEGFLVIGAGLSKAKWNGNYNEKVVAEKTGIVLDNLVAGQEKTIEFATAYINPKELEIYLSPKLSDLEAGVIAPCNFNNICESGEDYKNCASDCKPWGWVVFWIALLIAAAFVAYIIMKQWYKLNYERKLFKNRNELFNLTSFINNARAKGLGGLEIRAQLKKLGWKGEQINYVFGKTK